jgi:hypothetical protein
MMAVRAKLAVADVHVFWHCQRVREAMEKYVSIGPSPLLSLPILQVCGCLGRN